MELFAKKAFFSSKEKIIRMILCHLSFLCCGVAEPSYIFQEEKTARSILEQRQEKGSEPSSYQAGQKIFFDGLLFWTQKDWVVWIQGRPYTPLSCCLYDGVYIESVTQDGIKLCRTDSEKNKKTVFLYVGQAVPFEFMKKER